MRYLLLLTVPSVLCAQAKPKVHTLRAGPQTVAFGHYDPAKPPVLRINSGDIVDVTTMLTNSPTGLGRMGLPPEQVQPELRAIYDSVTDRGPGGHILTGPVHIEGAEPGDVIEVRILSIDLPLDYGYNGCSGFVRALCDAERRSRIIRMDRKAMKAEIAPGIVVPLKPFFGSMGVAHRLIRVASAVIRPANTRATWTTKSSSPARPFTFPCTWRARSSKWAMATPRRAMAK
jgi:acetamidase/formamidase